MYTAVYDNLLNSVSPIGSSQCDSDWLAEAMHMARCFAVWTYHNVTPLKGLSDSCQQVSQHVV